MKLDQLKVYQMINLSKLPRTEVEEILYSCDRYMETGDLDIENEEWIKDLAERAERTL